MTVRNKESKCDESERKIGSPHCCGTAYLNTGHDLTRPFVPGGTQSLNSGNLTA